MNYVDVGRGRCRPQCNRQMKMAAGLTRDIKRQVVKLSFDSATEIAEEMSTNVTCSNSSLCCSCVLTVLDNAH